VRSHGFALLGLSPAPDATPIHDVAIEADAKVALLLGAEGPGLSATALAHAVTRVRIPMAAGVDSLNVAVAAAIAFHHFAIPSQLQ
jgi:tRNA G18 (ribose-2'-O)-methylase SpoU